MAGGREADTSAGLRAGAALDRAAVMAALAAVAWCYAVFAVRIPEYLNSDMATEILVGREILARGSVLLSDFYYATELFLFRTSLFVAVWGLLTDSLLYAYRLAVATDVLLECLAIAYMMRRLGAGGWGTALAVLVFFGTRGYWSGQNTGLGGSSYGTMCMTAFLALGCYAASLKGDLCRADRAVGAAVAVLAFLFGMASVRLLAVVFLPLLAVHAAGRFTGRLPSPPSGDPALRRLALWAFLSLAGWRATLRLVLPRGFGPADYGSREANGLDTIASENLPEMATELFHNTPLFTVSDPFRLLSLDAANGVLFAAFVAAAVVLAFRAAGHGRPARRAVILFLALSTGVAVVTNLLFQVSASMRLRYLVFLFALLGLGAAFGWRDLARSRPAAARLFLLLACSLCVTNSVWNVGSLEPLRRSNLSRAAVRTLPAVEASFARHGVKRGYALFWHSAVQTVMTDGRIEVWGVTGRLTPLRYIAPYSVYAPGRSGDRTAFIRVREPLPEHLRRLPQHNVLRPEILDLAYAREAVEDPEAEVEIFYFDFNPFVFPPGHDPAAEMRKGADPPPDTV